MQQGGGWTQGVRQAETREELGRPWSLQRGKDGQVHGGAGRFGVGHVELRPQGPAGHPLGLRFLTSPSPGGQGPFRRLSPSPVTAGCPPLSSLVPLHFPSHVLCFSSPAALVPHIPCCFMLACPCFDFTLPSLPAPSSWLGHRLLLTQMALVQTHSFIPRTLIAACKVSDGTSGCCHLLPPLPPGHVGAPCERTSDLCSVQRNDFIYLFFSA